MELHPNPSNGNNTENEKVIVVGGGPCGALSACYFAKRGFQVEVYERRKDYRGGEMLEGRSINLALSERGIEALRRVGLESNITSNGVPMYGRVLHDKNGEVGFQPYGTPEQYILSISRQLLNELLLTAAENYKQKVKLMFEHKCKNVDLKTRTVTFEDMAGINPRDHHAHGKEVSTHGRVIIGADGAWSAVRESMRHRSGFDFSQHYIEHGYQELCIPATKDGNYALKHHEGLHIWPRGDYMLIALPNLDKSFTCTLFIPWKGGKWSFEEFAHNPEKLISFFKEEFPDAYPLMPTLVEDSKKNPPSPLVSISCFPLHYDDSALLLGDACHAMVPFYGQGLNASLQDVSVFFELFDQQNHDFKKTLPLYTEVRKPDADAITALSNENFVVMRQSVRSQYFLFKKKIEGLLHSLFPSVWVPQYTMVAFTTLPYSHVLQTAQWQERVLDRTLKTIAVGTLLAIPLGLVLYKNPPKFFSRL